MIWFAMTAFAQDRVLWDFDTSFPDTISGEHFFEVPWFEPHGTALVGQHSVWGEVDTLMYLDFPVPFVLTRETLSLRAQTRNDTWGNQRVYVEVLPVAPARDVDLGAWTTPFLVDALPCGAEVTLFFGGFGVFVLSDWSAPSVYIDDLSLTGAVCAEYVDGDADGLCPYGEDLDADGTCEDAGEPLAAVGDPLDCDDTTTGAACLRLEAGPVTPGGLVTLTVRGAEPGAQVGLLGARAPGTWCPAVLGGACADLDRPRRLGVVVADTEGAAVLEVAAPVSVVAGDSLWFQAVSERAGLPAVVAPAIQVVVEAP